MLKIAVTGAGGFIGSRVVEMLHLTGFADVVPVSHSVRSLSRSVRFDIEYRIADGRDPDALAQAFKSCDVVIDCMLLNPHVMPSAAESVYKAANAAAVRRLIYLSSASIYGQAPEPGTDETTALSIVQPFPYNAAKIKSERALNRCRKHGDTELVILRPGIVTGPRSRWISNIADELLSTGARLINGGTGICNSIYVDNLIHAMQLCTTASNIDGEAFIVGDAEQIIWLDLYKAIAAGLNVEMDVVNAAPVPSKKFSAPDLAEHLRASQPVQTVLPHVPFKLKKAVKSAIAELKKQDTDADQVIAANGAPELLSAEMSLLQQCQYKLPNNKAKAVLKYDPPVSFKEGCRRSLGWLSFAGYPVRPELR